MKRIVWLGSSKKDLKDFSGEGMRNAGYQLERVQLGLKPKDWKPMPAIGPGAEEYGYTRRTSTASFTWPDLKMSFTFFTAL